MGLLRLSFFIPGTLFGTLTEKFIYPYVQRHSAKHVEVVEMELNLEEILGVRKPEEFVENPPFKAKVLKVEARVHEYNGKERPQVEVVVRRLATKKDDGSWDETPSKPFRIYLPYSKRKSSKYATFTNALWEVAPDLMKNAKSLKDITGAIFIFETKEMTLGNIKANVTIPTKFLGVEPVTEEEISMVEAQEAEAQAGEIADEFAKEVL